MSWDLILQLAALVLLGAIVLIVGAVMWTVISETKHKRNLELIDRRAKAQGDDWAWRNKAGQEPDV